MAEMRNVNHGFGLNQPATYQIKVQGQLSRRWAVQFDDMAITTGSKDDDPAITIITGTVVDQAALHGLLNRIRDLNLPLLLVKRMEMA